MVKFFLISAASETERQANVASLQQQLPGIELVEAIYPSRQKVPFLKSAIQLSEQRTGKALLPGEIGCLLSHRMVWRKMLGLNIAEEDMVLILESDSYLIDSSIMLNMDKNILHQFDLFFWGAWDGHMKLFQSNRIQIPSGHQIGEPFIKTIYCTYGYCLNKKAARFLLERTGTFGHPVDQYKKFMGQHDLRIGGIKPELIKTIDSESNIRNGKQFHIFNQLFLTLLDLKNQFICFFK